MKAVSYSLFGYSQQQHKDCFDFNSYLRGLQVNIRVNRIIYPGWHNIINIDKRSYESPYKPIYDWLENKKLIKINLCKDAPLCMAMLWRMKPIFDQDEKDDWVYTHVICRDIDAVGTYREAQAVAQWIQEDKTIHCITDSISHNIPMMGGMVGFRPHYLTSRIDVRTWQKLINLGTFDWTTKGTDQSFLNKFIYPKCSDSATEHFVKGMRHNIAEADGRHYSIPDIEIDVDPVYKELDLVCGHIGSSGYYEAQMVKFLRELDPYRSEYKEIEKQFPTIFYWSA